jgi:hypothetical protein
MVLLKMMPQFYAVNVTGVLQRGEFPMKRAAGLDTACVVVLVNGVETGDFTSKQGVLGKLIPQ